MIYRKTKDSKNQKSLKNRRQGSGNDRNRNSNPGALVDYSKYERGDGDEDVGNDPTLFLHEEVATRAKNCQIKHPPETPGWPAATARGFIIITISKAESRTMDFSGKLPPELNLFTRALKRHKSLAAIYICVV